MKLRSFRHGIPIALAVPVFGISVLATLQYPPLLNPWHRPDGPFAWNPWYFVLPQLLCSFGIILNGVIALRLSRKHDDA